MILFCKPFEIMIVCMCRISQEKISLYRSNLEQRFGKSIEALGHELHFAAVFIIFGVTFSALTI
jgi:hypothetical protein